MCPKAQYCGKRLLAYVLLYRLMSSVSAGQALTLPQGATTQVDKA